MKKFIKVLALLLVCSMAGSAVPVSAMLTREEQEYYKKKKAEEKKKTPVQTQTQTQSQTPFAGSYREMVTSSGVHVEIENMGGAQAGIGTERVSETEAVTEAGSAAGTESVTEIGSEVETETESETEAETETKSTTEIETETKSTTEMETETESETWANEDAPLVAIDPGHQSKTVDFSATEPNGPGSDTMKPCYTEGGKGVTSGLTECDLNLTVAKKLKAELERRGYRVLLTRESNDVEISEAQRSQKANEAGADIYIRIHANSDEDEARKGALTGAPSAQNPYLGDIYNSCIKLADDILNEYCETTGLDNRGLWITDSLTGSNWSEMPVTLLEMGYMSNSEEDAYMADESNQEIMAEGIANGVDRYFGR